MRVTVVAFCVAHCSVEDSPVVMFVGTASKRRIAALDIGPVVTVTVMLAVACLPLVELVPVVEASIHPTDADTWGVRDGEPVRVRSRRGEIVCQARLSTAVAPGELFMPFVALQGAAANFLTNNVYDPNGMPEYKVCAVRIEPLGT